MNACTNTFVVVMFLPPVRVGRLVLPVAPVAAAVAGLGPGRRRCSNRGWLLAPPHTRAARSSGYRSMVLACVSMFRNCPGHRRQEQLR